MPTATSAPLAPLKLIALDAEDLSIVSAHVQDAVLLVGDMVYQPRDRRFVAIANRFDWALAATSPQQVRHRSAIRIEHIRSAKLQGIDLQAKQQTLALLAIEFTSADTDTPEGAITLLFAGGAAIRLTVDCIEAQLEDLGAAWAARSKPDHSEPA
jgi:Protein of unknown function (DUF2948)